MSAADALTRGRDAFGRRAWGAAYAELLAAAQVAPLEPEDLDRLATAAYLVGADDDSDDARVRAHHGFLARGEVERAVRCAFWLAFAMLDRGELARGSGWVARARRLLEDRPHDCVEQGYLCLPTALRCIAEGDAAGADAAFGHAAGIGARFAEPDLLALATHGRGRALIRLGRIAEGVSLLDEAMVALEVDDLSPLVVGDVYCSAIAGCLEILDVRRAREWTTALARWCEARLDLMPYRGPCLVNRAEIRLLHGSWPDAADDVRRACEQLLDPPGQPGAGAALYQRAELHRLRGESVAADEAYREASRCGRSPQPGLARLRLAQGRADVAAAMIRRALEEAGERRSRARLLPAVVDIMLGMHDVPSARAAANELSALAAELDTPFMRASAAYAMGAVLVADDDASAALPALRQAWAAWQDVGAPYEAARVRALIGLACRALGDEDTAAMELDAARAVFDELGAVPDRRRAETLVGVRPAARHAGLTTRELQVLRVVAAGHTNRAIADALRISERTVARHVSNIFTKLGLSTRAAATAYAYEHGLV